uniref:alpha/beta fold hydrolase n=1 Tax=Methylobacterium sp. B34 TaxID=95563 RepID=UPI0016515F92|nr:alpha/beta hydrolase [Methylobacterium sp. B34]
MISGTRFRIIKHFPLGHGPQKVVVLHDWHSDHTVYDPILPYLDGKVFHYAFADLPGYGLSHDYAVPSDIEQIAATVIALADSLEWYQFHIVGHSLSAMIAQYVAVLEPERIASLTAVCPIPASGSFANDDALAFFATTTEDTDAFHRLIGFLSGQLSNGWREAKWVRSRLASSPEVKMQYYPLFRTDFSRRLFGSTTKVNLILGDHDPGLDEATLAPVFRSWFRDLAIETVSNCGHYPMEEAPPYFATTLERLLIREAVKPS